MCQSAQALLNDCFQDDYEHAARPSELLEYEIYASKQVDCFKKRVATVMGGPNLRRAVRSPPI